MKIVGVMLCSQTKKDYECDVRQMYNDSLAFRARRIFLDFAYDEWYVNTSKYGFMEPSKIIEPYDSWYIKPTTRNRASTLTEGMVDEWLEGLKQQFPNRDEIYLHCHLSRPYYEKLATIFPNIVYITQQKQNAQTAWRYYDATMMLLDGHSVVEAINFINQPLPKTKRKEKDKWFYHNEYPAYYGKSSKLAEQYDINDINLWSVSMGDIAQTCGWCIDKKLLPHINKHENGTWRLDKGYSKRNENFTRPNVKQRLDELEEIIGGRTYRDFHNAYDDIMEILNTEWKKHNNDGYAKLVIYEHSIELIDELLPNHGLNDYFLEGATFMWLNNEN